MWKIQHFSGKDTDKKYSSECTKIRHLKKKKHSFLGRAKYTLPVGRVPLRTLAPQSLLDPPRIPKNSSQICANGGTLPVGLRL